MPLTPKITERPKSITEPTLRMTQHSQRWVKAIIYYKELHHLAAGQPERSRNLPTRYLRTAAGKRSVLSGV